MLRERRQAQFNQITAPAITRVVDAAERLRDGRFRNPPIGRDGRPRGRLWLEPSNPIPAGLPRRTDVEQGIAQALRESNLSVGRIVTGLKPVDRNDPRLKNFEPSRADRLARLGAELHIAVEIPNAGWIVMSSGFPRGQ